MLGGEEHLAELLDGGPLLALHHFHAEVGLDHLVVGLCCVAQRPWPFDWLKMKSGSNVSDLILDE